MKHRASLPIILVCCCLLHEPVLPAFNDNSKSALWSEGIGVIPYPQSVIMTGKDFVFDDKVFIRIEGKASVEDLFSAEELCRGLSERWNINCRITDRPQVREIILKPGRKAGKADDQSYGIETGNDKIIVTSAGSAGLFYGIQTLLQLVTESDKKIFIKGLIIRDKPDIPIRAVHYDTKHFQEKKEYVKDFIRTLAGYKINMLIWEWEDKFAYKSHPEIGAPGAFTMEEMQELTYFARKYHIQIVPLVQGLGHVSFILKHPENFHLREIESNNWGFCPLREGTYELMNDLIREAAEATPGSEYLHIGCDETYVLGKGSACGCKEKAEQEGIYALREIYINRMGEQVKNLKRIPMAWDGGFDPREKIKPIKGLFTPGGFDDYLDSASIKNGYPLYIYDPNPGIEHLFLPYFYRENEAGQIRAHLEEAYEAITGTVRTGKFKGIISTSWNCSGVHNQLWMLRYLTTAEFSWNGNGPLLDEFIDTFFFNYYGPESRNVKELFLLLNKASYYYMSTFERKVWHWGEVGKTHLPDLPRDDMEFDPFWNTEYSELTARSAEIIPQMERVLEICSDNRNRRTKNLYDFELFEGLSRLFIHTAKTCLSLSELEKSVAHAASLHFDNNRATYNELIRATEIIEKNLEERGRIFNDIRIIWEKSQLPKGMSTSEKVYLHARDQQRNFANRRPDLSFMICDEEALGLEDYLEKLRNYMDGYKKKYLSD